MWEGVRGGGGVVGGGEGEVELWEATAVLLNVGRYRRQGRRRAGRGNANALEWAGGSAAAHARLGGSTVALPEPRRCKGVSG